MNVDLPPRKTLEFHNVVIDVRSVFHGDNKYYSQAFLDECLYKLQMLEEDRIDVSEAIDVNKTNHLHGHCWYFLEINLDISQTYVMV